MDRGSSEAACSGGKREARAMVGRSFGRRLVLGPASGADRWFVRCTCGTESIARGDQLRAGRARSCGCLQREKARAAHLKHGAAARAAQLPEYVVWKGIVQRCTNPRSKAYPRYGGRGIAICERWLSFENFLADMGSRPSSAHSVERKNNDGPYAPDNCTWATRAEQNRNQHRTRRLVIGGASSPIAELEDRVGLPRGRIRRRVDAGWDPNEALQPVASRTKLSSAQVAEIRARYASGDISQRALARLYGVHGTTVRDIVNGTSWRSA